MVRLSSQPLCALIMIVSTNILSSTAMAQSHYATGIVSYEAGTTPAMTFGGDPYTDPATALGRPERFTGEGSGFDAAVTPFNPPFLTSELVSVGEGGHITLAFDRPITDDPAHKFGQDLILFTNAGFIDADFPNGTLGIPAATFGNDDAIVEVSEDGVNFLPVSHNLADGLFPTLGYLDVDPFSPVPGLVKTSFVDPMDPTITLFDLDGLTYTQLLALYGTSGGGTPIDIAATGLSSVNFVRISVLDDNNANTSLNFELDAVAVVPEPATALLLGPALLLLARKRKNGFTPQRHAPQCRPTRRVHRRVLAALVCGLAGLPRTSQAYAETWIETFDTDPIAGGRLVLSEGDPSRFLYDAVGKSLTASYNTGLPTARLIHVLAQTYDDQDDFTFEFDFEILSAGFFADPFQAAQIAFGMINTVTTGTDRAGAAGGSAYDICTFDYFPNVTFFGGPSLGPTIINTQDGSGFFNQIQFEFGHETDIGAEGAVPLDTPLTARVVYDGRRRVATLTLEDTSGLLAINTSGGRGLGSPVPGGFDGDNATIQLEDFGETFAVDGIGPLLWNDSFAVTPSVIADVVFTRILFQGTKQPQAGPADLDADGDADGTDFLTFSNCFNGANTGIRFGCRRSDLDQDGADVDGTDFLTFSNCFNGALNPPHCP